MTTIENAATLLATLRQTKETIANIPDAIQPADEAAAYTIQAELVSSLLNTHGGHLVGYKVACTSEHAQTLLKVVGPFSGRMMSATTYTSPATLASGDFNRCVIEPEFAFVVAEAIPAGAYPLTADSIVDYLGDFIPAIEIVDHRFDDFTIVGDKALIADNAIHGACVLGEPISDWKGLDLANHAVSLTVNGELYNVGSGAAVLGNPLNVMAWLANDLQRRGDSFTAGDIVVTGVATKTYQAQSGDECIVDFGSLGSVSVRYQ